MQQDLIKDLEARFIRYVRIDTQSDETSADVPSTAIQLDLLRLLKQELEEIGANDVRLTDYGCVLATVPGNLPDGAIPPIAFLAHADTAPAFNASGVKPIVHRAYAGDEIILPADPDQRLSPETEPDLADKIGQDIITASGTTLLGADNKAGIAIIMMLTDHLLRHPDIPHGDIHICFTPDEEIGRGVEHLTLEDLGAQFAYTLDGGPLGEITYETFSADKALVTITGVSTHTGTAKGRLVNALLLAAKFADMLPQHTRTPETTEGREGFVHLYKIEGTGAYAELHYILRDFDLDGLAAHGDLLMAAAETLRAGEPRAKITCEITPQYRNMRYWLEDDMRPVELAMEAIRRAGLEPVITPVRGGTDGSRLTEMGLPTPNIFTGTHNAHGPLEWISLQDMAEAVRVCAGLVALCAEGEEKGVGS